MHHCYSIIAKNEGMFIHPPALERGSIMLLNKNSPNHKIAKSQQLNLCELFVLVREIQMFGQGVTAELTGFYFMCFFQISMDVNQKFCLKWNNFQSSVTSVFDNLRQDEELVDITLCCEGQKIKAHRMMLSACSPYFRDLLKV